MGDPGREQWDYFVERLDDFRGLLRRYTGDRVKAQPVRDAARLIFRQYFRETRPELEMLGLHTERLEALDSEIGELHRLSNTAAKRKKYQDLLKRLVKLQQHVELERETNIGRSAHVQAPASSSILSGVEGRILDTLRKLIPSAASSYEQAVMDLRTERASYRGTASELREALREVVDHCAPDGDVMKASDYTQEPGRTKPTQRQKVMFVLRRRRQSGAAMKTPMGALEVVEGLTASLTRSCYVRSSISVHTNTSRQEVQQMKMYIDSVLAELLEVHA